MRAANRVLLIDVDGVVGPDAPRPELVRERVAAVLRAAGPVHHALACYTGEPVGLDELGSALAELGVPSRAVPPGRGAVAGALLAHARYAHGQGCRAFALAADHHGVMPVDVVDGHDRDRVAVVRAVRTALAAAVAAALGRTLGEQVSRSARKHLRKSS
ncbi:hypothetical protein [Saccharothrix xinjiangensis]|uniref:Uncharacterized protein n=1 Tax=Saccharothrix xinjiangensis TaxID=204798 RepID=A0ABV9Y621_9PSEU